MPNINEIEIDKYTDNSTNHSERILISFCIDCSYSMRKEIPEIRTALKSFLQKTMSDPRLVDSARLHIVTFAEGFEDLLPTKYTPISSYTDEDIDRISMKENQSSSMFCPAANHLLDDTEAEWEELSSFNNSCAHPMLFFFSDGYFDDREEELKAVVSRLQSYDKGKMHVDSYCLSVNDKYNDMLKQLDINHRVRVLKTEDDIREYIGMIYQSIQVYSRQAYGLDGGNKLDY